MLLVFDILCESIKEMALSKMLTNIVMDFLYILTGMTSSLWKYLPIYLSPAHLGSMSNLEFTFVYVSVFPCICVLICPGPILLNPYNADLFFIRPCRLKGFFQFEIIINVSVIQMSQFI